MKPYAFHREASEEYIEAVRYYFAVAPPLGRRLRDEVERLIVEIRREPNRFARFEANTQRALSRRFPYSVIYLDLPDRIWIVAIMHAKREPGYWRKRIS